MSWWGYVTRTSGTESPKVMQGASGIDSPNFSRWKGGHTPKAEMVAMFARAYGRPVLEAFVAAGFLTAEEAKARPSQAPTLNSLTDEQLLGEVRERMSRNGATNSRAPGSGANELDEKRREQESVTRAVKKAARHGKTDRPGTDQSTD